MHEMVKNFIDVLSYGIREQNDDASTGSPYFI